MNQNQDFIYYAFISYSHKDEKWAKWLQRKLESYRLPTVIRKESGRPLPRRILPVFLDATDLSVGNLNANLKQELAASRYLIVICSPNSAKPNAAGFHYVDTEVNHFCQLGREENIIPVIIDGSPGSPDRNCFCPKIHELGLVGLDATKHSRARILNDVVAKILSLRPDDLWQREKRRIRRRRIMGTLAGVFLLAVALFAGWLTWDWNRAFTEYYADYVDQWGLPHGIFPLKKEQTLSRNSHYRFIYRNRDKLFGKRILREVVFCNSAGTPIDFNSGDMRFVGRPVKQEILYNDKYELLSIIDHGKIGTLQEQRNFSGHDKSVVDFRKKMIDENEAEFGTFRKSDNGGELAGFTSPLAEMPETGKTAIKRWGIERDESGYTKKIVFYRDDVALSPSSDADGCFGKRYELDEFGRIRVQYFLDENGEDMTLKNGIGSIEYEYEKENVSATIKKDGEGKTIEKLIFYYDDNGNVVKEEFYTGNKLSFCEDGWAVIKYRYDKHGFPSEMSFWGVDGKPCFNLIGIAKAVIQCNEQGIPEEESYFDNHDRPCLNKNGAAKTKIVRRNSEQGYITELSFFDADGKLCLSKKGIAKIVTQYDMRGNKKEESYFGTDEKLRTISVGIAKVAWQYDDRGNLREAAYFGENGKPCLNKNGIAKISIQYDERGNLREAAFRGLNNELCFNRAEGCARWERKYNERGNPVEESYFNANNKPCFSSVGAARIVRQYNEDGNPKEIAYYDVDNKPCMNSKNGYAKAAIQYNRRGLPTKIEYFDVNDKPCLNEDKISCGVMQYDERGNLRVVASFGTNGEPCLNKKLRVAKVVKRYDERGNETEAAYFGVNEKPCLCKFGYAKMAMKYDDRNQMTEIAFLNVYDNLCSDVESGIAKCVIRYDERGNKTEETFFGVDGKPCPCKGGYARAVFQYDVFGECVGYKMFDLEGKLIKSSGENIKKQKKQKLLDNL